jgi:hypothetical protein
MRHYIRIAVLFIISASILTACATQPTPAAYEPPGFLLGFVHGIISPFALVAELFTNVRIYAFPNSGGWYDLGFMLGIGALGGGGSRAI